MNWGLETTMLHVFDAAAWRETFLRTKGSPNKVLVRWLYETYLQSNAWKIKRAARREIDGDRCRGVMCFRVDGLEVHHSTYERIGDENVETDLITLYRNCHAGEHGHEHEQLFHEAIWKRA